MRTDAAALREACDEGLAQLSQLGPDATAEEIVAVGEEAAEAALLAMVRGMLDHATDAILRGETLAEALARYEAETT